MKKIINYVKNADRGTIIRSVSLVLAIINQVVAVLGASSFASAVWYQTLSVCATALTSVVAAWENNDFTCFAKLGTKLLDALEDGKITESEVKSFFKKKGIDEK